MGMNNNISEVNSGWMDESSTKIWMYTFYFLFMFDLPVFLSFLSFSSAILSPWRFLVDLHFWIYELKLRRLKLETTMSLIFFLLFLDIFFLSPSFSLAHSLLSFTANFFFHLSSVDFHSKFAKFPRNSNVPVNSRRRSSIVMFFKTRKRRFS